MTERGCEHHEGARPFMATTACLKAITTIEPAHWTNAGVAAGSRCLL